MKRILTIVSLMLTVLTVMMGSIAAQAYESDTHFDVMYHLSRAAGLNDGLSKMLALANQHIDEGLISSPMLLSVQRQLFHFPGDLEKVEIEGHGAISLPSRIFKSKLALAERNSAIGNYLIYLGLKEGDLTLIGLGMHVKMDTYGHAGHSNLLGHMEVGHNPDRAFLEKEKYEDMIRSVMQSLVAVRKLLPKEALDMNSALSYLNKFSKEKTFSGRDLTIADMDDATKISGVVLEDAELQSIYRESMFRKYEYKKLALEKIYAKFHRSGEINSDITLDELFPEYLIHDPRLTVKDIIKYVIVTTTDAEFLKSEGGKEIFNLKKLFGFRSEEIFKKKVALEVQRAEFRLRQYFFKEKQLKDLSEQYGVDLNNWEYMIDEFNVHVRDAFARGEKPPFNDVLLYLSDRFKVSVSKLREIKNTNDRLIEEKNYLLKGIGSSSDYELGSENYIKLRSHELGEGRIAEDISIKLTKDLIPIERTQYVKQNFEGNNDTRMFERDYKATAYRLHRLKYWGVNFLHAEDKTSLLFKFKVAYIRFKDFMKRNTTSKMIEDWKVLAFNSATKFMQIDPDLASLDQAEGIGFTKEMKSDAFKKLLRYVGPAIFPWAFGQKSGFSYISKLIAKAKLVAKDHEVEDMKEAAESGKYSKDLWASKKSKKAVEFARGLNRSSEIIRCEIMF